MENTNTNNSITVYTEEEFEEMLEEIENGKY